LFALGVGTAGDAAIKRHSRMIAAPVGPNGYGEKLTGIAP